MARMPRLAQISQGTTLPNTFPANNNKSSKKENARSPRLIPICQSSDLSVSLPSARNSAVTSAPSTVAGSTAKRSKKQNTSNVSMQPRVCMRSPHLYHPAPSSENVSQRRRPRLPLSKPPTTSNRSRPCDHGIYTAVSRTVYASRFPPFADTTMCISCLGCLTSTLLFMLTSHASEIPHRFA